MHLHKARYLGLGRFTKPMREAHTTFVLFLTKRELFAPKLLQPILPQPSDADLDTPRSPCGPFAGF